MTSKSFFNILFFSCTILLTSCTAQYIQPTPGEPSATIKGFESRKNLNNYEIAEVLQIDGKRNPFYYNPTKEVLVTPGSHNFVVSSISEHGFLSTRYQTEADISATLKAGNHYRLMQEIHDKQATIWIIDEAGKKISQPVSFQINPRLSHSTMMGLMSSIK